MQKETWIEKIKKGLKYLWGQVIFPNLIWSAILGFPSAVGSAVIVYRSLILISESKNIPPQYLWGAIVALAVCVISIVLNVILCICLLRSKKKRPVFPELTFDYRTTNAEYELFFKDRTHIEQRQSADILAQKDNVQDIVHNMGWTGQTYVGSTLDTTCNGVTLTDTTRKSAPYPVIITFNKPLMNGQRGSYAFGTKVEDPNCCMMPYLAKLIKCQTDKLTIKVTAPKGMLKNVYRCISTDATLDIKLAEPQPVTPKIVGDFELFEWTIENLELLRCYSINWDFA